MQTRNKIKNLEYKHLFGPVNSRRLGLSLGVDIVPLKTCSYNCVYCQLGKASKTVVKRKEYVKTKHVLKELQKKISEGLNADYITFSGSGEPTLNSKIGKMIGEIKKITKIPVCVITNGSLLGLPAVRKSILNADLVIPSLDAGTEEAFNKINRPDPAVSFTEMIDGLISFRVEYKGKMHLEIFLVEGLNTNDDEIKAIKGVVQRVLPDKIELNTIDRPPAEGNLKPATLKKLEKIREILGNNAQIITRKKNDNEKLQKMAYIDDLINLLKRRPCTLDDISIGLSVNKTVIVKGIAYLKAQKSIEESERNGQIYYHFKE